MTELRNSGERGGAAGASERARARRQATPPARLGTHLRGRASVTRARVLLGLKMGARLGGGATIGRGSEASARGQKSRSVAGTAD